MYDIYENGLVQDRTTNFFENGEDVTVDSDRWTIIKFLWPELMDIDLEDI